jgi:hypothetical protein
VDGQRLAAVWACGARSWLSYASAGAFYTIYRERKLGWDVSIYRGHGGRRGAGLIRLHHLRTLHPDDVTIKRKVPVTTVSRTLVDLAWVLKPDALERAVHEAEVTRQLDVAAVESVIARMPSRLGVAELQKILGISAAEPTNSEFVRLFLRFGSDYGLPTPRAGLYLDAGLPLLKETDLWFPDAKLIVELDGAAVHMTRRNFESDRRRDVAFLARGIATVRVTWRRLTQEPQGLAEELLAIMAQRWAQGAGAVPISREMRG